MMIPPHNTEAEQSILSSIMINQNFLGDVISIIKPSDFYHTKHQIIFDTMMKMYQEGINIDPVTLKDNLKSKLDEIGGLTYILQLFNSGIPVDIKEYANIVKEKSNKRQIYNIGANMCKEAFDDEKISKDILNATEDKIYSLSVNKSKDPVSISDGLTSTFNLIEKNYKRGGGITGISTGYPGIDQKINGLNRGDFIIIAGRPSMGKSALALNIAANVSKTNYVAFLSLEMDKDQLIQRILSFETMIRHENIRQGNLNDDNFLKLAQVSGELSERKFIIDDTSVMNVSEIKAKAKKIKIKNGLDVLFIDYLGIIENGIKAENRQQEMSNMSRQLKTMAKELGCAVVALSQLNRNPEARPDKHPLLSDLRESGGIEQDADIVILLYRDDYYHSDSKKKGITECIIAKNRNGAIGVQELGWLGEFQQFRKLEKGEI